MITSSSVAQNAEWKITLELKIRETIQNVWKLKNIVQSATKKPYIKKRNKGLTLFFYLFICLFIYRKYFMEVKKFSGNDIFSNSYLIINNSAAVIIDPLVNSNKLISFLNENNITLKAILLTHGHYDHIKGVSKLYNSYHCPIYLHYEEEEIIRDKYKNCSTLFNDSYVLNDSITYLDEMLIIEDFNIQVIHTPFHTQGSVCFYFKDINSLFSGDTLFKRGIGRYDLYSGNKRLISSSLHKLVDLYNLEGNMKVYPGHGPSTYLEDEIKFSPYFE